MGDGGPYGTARALRAGGCGPRPLIHKQEIGQEVASKEETPVPGLHYVERIPRWSYKEY